MRREEEGKKENEREKIKKERDEKSLFKVESTTKITG